MGLSGLKNFEGEEAHNRNLQYTREHAKKMRLFTPTCKYYEEKTFRN